RNSQVYYERGDLYWRLWKLEQARDDFQKAVEHDPDNAEALSELGNVLSEMGEKEEVILPLLTRAVELRPRYWKYYVRLSWPYERRGQRKPKSAAVRRKLAELFPPGSAEAHYNLGQACRLVEDFRTAREHFEKCLSIAPSEYSSHAEALLNLGRVL